MTKSTKNKKTQNPACQTDRPVGQVGVIFAGGRPEKFNNRQDFNALFNSLLEVYLVSGFNPIFIGGGMSSLSCETRNILLRRLLREWKNYCGFVITLPREHFLTTANLLTYILDDVGKPVIFTTASKISEQQSALSGYKEMSLRANIVNASLAASAATGGTMVVMGSDFVPAGHARLVERRDPVTNEILEQVTSIDNYKVGAINIGVQLTNHAQPFFDHKPTLWPAVEEQTHWINLSKSVEAFTVKDKASTALYQMVLQKELKENKKASAFILESEKPFTHKLIQTIPNQRATLLFSPEGAQLLEKGRVRSVGNMILSTAAAKFMWILGQRRNREFENKFGNNLFDLMRLNFRNEFLTSKI